MSSRVNRTHRLAVAFLLLVASGCAPGAPKQAVFSSAEAAASSLVDALRAGDRARLKEILGPAGDEILSSGDEAADRADVDSFLAHYDAGPRVRPGPPLGGGAGAGNTLLVGPDEWPFPVPIVKSGRGYVFDTEAGKDEVLNRRIGGNELDAQQVCLAIADAQREYVKLNPSGDEPPQYARKFVSDPGTKNGLYWPTAEGEPASPLGPLAASAAAEGYGASAGPRSAPSSSSSTSAPVRQPRPYHGYNYRLLTAQGPHAPGGAADYVVDGRLVGGFAIVAYPAQYGNSGIMTFIASHDGVVYQRDLGPDTEQAARRMAEFDPGPGWEKAADGSDFVRRD